MYALIVARKFDSASIRASYHFLETGEWITVEATEETMAQALENIRQQEAVAPQQKDERRWGRHHHRSSA